MLSNKFICATREYSTYKNFVPSPYLRKTFIAYELPKKCTITIGCAGFYDVFIHSCIVFIFVGGFKKMLQF